MQRYKSVIHIISKLVRFPRRELESRWWHKLFKTVIVISTLLLALQYWRWADEVFRPYYIYSFEQDFGKYAGYRIKNLSDINPSDGDKVGLIVTFKVSGSSEAHQYVGALDRANIPADEILREMRVRGYLADVKIKDVQTDFWGSYEKVFWVIILTIASYITMSQVLYPIIAYILPGRPESHEGA
jgi:hypothetical protein